jgi:hypothetical protein
MALDITQLKAAFAKKSESTEKTGNTGFWNMFYPFYKMGFDETSTFRFLPDLDDENPLGFIVENRFHELWINGKKKQIACLKMYGEDCPCCDKSSEFYNGGDQTLGKTFYRKIDYVASGIVIKSAFEYIIKPEENPVRLVSMTKQLYEKLETEIVKGDLDAMPYDMQNGYDFRIIKNKKVVPDGKGGQKEYGNYTDSGFARKSTPIPEEYLSRIELLDVKNYRFAKIEREQMEIMIEAALTGRTFDDKPSVADQVASPKPTQNADAVVAAIAEPTVVAPTNTVAAPAAGTTKLTPAEILAKLKARQAN